MVGECGRIGHACPLVLWREREGGRKNDRE